MKCHAMQLQCGDVTQGTVWEPCLHPGVWILCDDGPSGVTRRDPYCRLLQGSVSKTIASTGATQKNVAHDYNAA